MEKFLNGLKAFFKGLFGKKRTEPTEVKPPVELPVGNIPPIIHSDELAQKIYDRWLFHITKWIGFLENQGDNKGTILSPMIISVGGKPGHAYCLFGQQRMKKDVCSDLNIILDGWVETGSTQTFFNKIPSKYKYMIPKVGDIVIWQSKKDPSKGHAAWVKELIYENGKLVAFITIEFNTNSQGSREGEGCFQLKRPFITENSIARLRGFVRVSEMARVV